MQLVEGDINGSHVFLYDYDIYRFFTDSNITDEEIIITFEWESDTNVDAITHATNVAIGIENEKEGNTFCVPFTWNDKRRIAFRVPFNWRDEPLRALIGGVEKDNGGWIPGTVQGLGVIVI